MEKKYTYFGIRVQPDGRINRGSVKYIMERLGFKRTGQLFRFMMEMQFKNELTAYQNSTRNYTNTDKESLP